MTARVATLGYSHPPAIVVMTRGPADLVQPWLDGLRASPHARIVAVGSDDVPDGDQELCTKALEAANVTPIEEILVIEAVESSTVIDECRAGKTGICTQRLYAGKSVTVTTKLTAYRASSCTLLRSTSLPLAIGRTEPRPGVDYTTSPETEDRTPIEEADASDTQVARANAIARLQAFASSMAWGVFPTEWSIQRVERTAIVIAGPLALGDYFLKTPGSAELRDGIRATAVERNQTRLELDNDLDPPEPGDELHAVTDMMTMAGFTTITGGTVRANGKTHGIGGATGILRWSWDHSPKLFEMQLCGELVPGIDSRHVDVGFAAGLRWPAWISPFVLVELGLGGVYQGDHGARAVAGRAGVGAGLEVRGAWWAVFADVRLRGLALGDYTDSDENPLEVTYPDTTWQSATGQVGVGFSY